MNIASMNAAKALCLWGVLSLVALAPARAGAEVVEYTLENVILDDSNAQMFGTFLWTYDVGDFENGAGEFTFLDIPFTWHDHTDLTANFDMGGSIEITLEGSVHDDGVDITLFLVQPLTPTTGSPIDLVRSQYEIGGNGFHDGLFLSGSVIPSEVVDVGSASIPVTNTLVAYPNPFHPQTNLAYSLTRPGLVRLSIHDARGRLVTTLVDEWQSSGRYSAPWSGTGLESGLYFVRLLIGSDTTTRKVVLMH